MELEEQKQNRSSDNRFLLENILLQILSRLPVKSLLKFMCVCRRWKTLISSRTLRKLHQEIHSSSPPLILTLHSSKKMNCMLPDYYLTAFDLYGNVLQCRTLPISSENLAMMPVPPHANLLGFVDMIENTNFFYNPSTRQIFRLPNSPSFSLPEEIWFRQYGYIPSKDEYMMAIMCERNSPKPKSWVCEILTVSISDDNFQLHYSQWRSIEVTTSIIKDVEMGVFVRGVFYWPAELEGDEGCCILSFDVETNVFSTIGLPQGVGKSCTPFELKDELYLTFLTTRCKRNRLTTFEWWKFGIYNKKKVWTPYWKIDCRDIGYRFMPNNEHFEYDVLIWRLEYLNLYSSKVSKEMGKLVFLQEHHHLEEDEDGKLKPLGEDIMRPLIEKRHGSLSDYYMDYSSIEIHSNLFTL